MWAAPLWAPTMWAPAMWAHPGFTVSPVAAGARGRDTTVLRDIQARLQATGVFDAVCRFSPEEWPRPAAQTALAFVEPDRWSETDELGDHTYTRRLNFTLTFLVRDEDPVARTEKLDYLYTVATNALVGQQFAGICLPVRTAIGKGTYTTTKPPERSLVCQGSCAYLVPGYAARDATDPEGY